MNKAVYFVMVDEQGAVELTCPVVRDGKFIEFLKRYFISDGSDVRDNPSTLPLDLEPPVDNFAVNVRSKR